MSVTTAYMKIPVTKPFLGEEEERAVVEVLRSGWVVQGPKVAEFERTVADYVGAKHAVATSSCTTALHLALALHGIGPGDEVIVPSFTFIATANAILYQGATPVFVDIDPHTYNIDPHLIEAAITPRTKAVLPVHQIGLAADMERNQRHRSSSPPRRDRGCRPEHRSNLPRPSRGRTRQRHVSEFSSPQSDHHRRGRNDPHR